MSGPGANMKSLRLLVLPLGAAVALLLWVVLQTLGPVALLVCAAVLLWPARQTPEGRTIRSFLLILIALWILHQARWVVYPLVGGTILAYILVPLVEWFVAHRVRRPLAVILALLPIGLLAVLTLMLLIPALVAQISLVLQKLPAAYDLLQARLSPWLSRAGVPRLVTPPAIPIPGTPVAPEAPAQPAWLEQLTRHAEEILQAAGGGLLGVSKGLGKILPWIGVLFLTPVTAYYLLADWEALGRGLLTWLPHRGHGPVKRLSAEIQSALRIYVRGQVLVAVIEAALFSVGFALAGLPDPVALGVLGGLLSLIPIVGFWLTATLVALSALTGSGPWSVLVKSAVVLMLVNLLEGQLLVPRIQGKGLGLHPLAVLLGVLLFGTLFGFLGMLVAVPCLAVMRALLPEIRKETAGAGRD